jgi:hypothetical protein
MPVEYPLEFTLEDGTFVVVNRVSTNTYDFALTPEKGPVTHFSYVDDGRTKTEVEENMNFDELNALRRFWLENEDMD